LAEFHAFPEEDLRDESITARKIIAEYRDNKRKRPESWEEMFQLELVLLQILPDEVLRHKAAIVEAKYLAAGLPQLAAPPGDAVPLGIRSRAQAMTSELQWGFRKGLELQFAARRLRQTVFMNFGVIGAMLMTVSVATHVWTPSAKPVSLVFVCMLMGLLGSFTSILRRLTLASAAGNGQPARYATVTELDTGTGSVSLALLSGVIFGLLAFLLTVSGILAVDGLTPTLPAACIEAASSCSLPLDELAKLLIWCFLAGFAEQLIPDVLDKLAGKARADKAAAKAG
ncbi:MAG: hypothetical protein HZC24_00285, partial [Rhodocyclales bacterium]|nr:hypothetical protein [Rhodocyclales bacterium]